ncbi:MAG: DUF362 domain-containing protein [Planctomycetota bacterium]|jgi:uncharacterized protein (DUF362 family)/Pyruvate/2-oxoacid:ferredoxin oxidoreductase delta subunit|nr:DUF362 domain-containing protein [Planctomycetota bacterium]
MADRNRPLVSLFPCNDYQPEKIQDALRSLLAPFGGMGAFVRKGARVILKPNLVFGRSPEQAVNTHPSVVRAVASMAIEAGAGRVAIGDSPGIGSAAFAARPPGLAAVAAELGLEIVEFTAVTIPAPDGCPFPNLEVSRELLDADLVINLPKMKTHAQMLMTLAVKNLFGAVPGARKLQWHYRAGKDRRLFARIINAVAAAIRPALSILDAVVGMDGQGPTAGRARSVGFLAAGSDPWAVDAAVMDILGLDRESLFTLADAAEYGPREWLNMRLSGSDPADLRPRGWDIPELRTLHMHGGFVERWLPFLAKWLRTGISPIPVPNPVCTGCGRCRDVCPAKAIRLAAGRPVINGADCIRCYCCHEFCPEGCMSVAPIGFFGRLLGLKR